MYLSQFLYNLFKISYRARKWYLRNLYARITPKSTHITMVDGIQFNLMPKYDYVQREIFLHQGKYIYESHIVNWIKNYLQPGMVVVDIGSHIGYYLGPICLQIGSEGRGYFIEPSRDHFGLLQTNISNNSFQMAIPKNTAISDQTGSISFFPATDSGRNSLVKNSITDQPSYSVQAMTLEDFLESESLHFVDLLQLDVEGAEAAILLGSERVLKEKRIKTILCEWHPKQMKDDFNTDPIEMKNFLVRCGFNSFRINNLGMLKNISDDDLNMYQHVVFITE